MTPPAPESPLLAALAPVVELMRAHPDPRSSETEAHFEELLYHRCHARWETKHHGELGRNEAKGGLARDFVARLSNANCGVGADHEWRVAAVEEDGRVVVEEDGLLLWVDPQPGATPGETMMVRFPKEYRALYPGHYVAIGDADCGSLPGAVRLYWNVEVQGAEPLVGSVSQRFNRARVPFRLKILSDPAGYGRSDAAILYLPADAHAEGAGLIREVYRDVSSRLRPVVSAYVLQLAPGLGLAENPGDRTSYGQHRSRLLVPILYDALPMEDPLEAIAAALKRIGYPPERFHLSPGSSESYQAFRIDG